jgi:hypothetical protein
MILSCKPRVGKTTNFRRLLKRIPFKINNKEISRDLENSKQLWRPVGEPFRR